MTIFDLRWRFLWNPSDARTALVRGTWTGRATDKLCLLCLPWPWRAPSKGSNSHRGYYYARAPNVQPKVYEPRGSALSIFCGLGLAVTLTYRW